MIMVYVASEQRYESMTYRRTGRSGLKLPAISLGLWHNFGEKQFSLISGLDSMSSQNAQGQTRITLQMRLDRNIDAAFQDVQAAVSAAIRQLPRDMPSPPSIRKVNPAEGSVLFLTASSQTLPLSDVNRYVEDLLLG